MEKNWYAVYTRSRFEKKVFIELEKKGVEVFLPMWKQLSQWSDRKKLIDAPIFKSYVFVNINLVKEHIKILETKGIVKFISFKGKIAKISEKDLNWIRIISGESVTPIHDIKDFVPGDKVKISSGPMKDIEGIVSRTTKKIIQIYFESLDQVIYLEIKPELLKKI